MKYPRELIKREKVQVYRNLHTGKLSVRAMNEVGRMTVVAHVDNVFLLDAKFIVNENGRQRVIREKRKNVHALVEGILLCANKPNNPNLPITLTYNPYKFNSFVTKNDNKPVRERKLAYIEANGLITTVKR